MCFPQLFTVKLLYFTWFGATSCLLPFLSLHMRSVGIPLWESTIISAIVPLIQLLTCSTTSCIPKHGLPYKKTTLWALLFTAIVALLLVFSPAVPRASPQPISMSFLCGPKVEPAIVVDKCNYNCENDTTLLQKVDIFFLECHVVCPNKSGRFKNMADVCFNGRHRRLCHVLEINNTLLDNFTFGAFLGSNQDISDENQCSYPVQGVTWHERYFHHVTCPIIVAEPNSNCVLKCSMNEVGKPQISGIQHCLNVGPKSVNFAIGVYIALRALFHLCLGMSSMLIERSLLHILKKERKSARKYTLWSLIASGIVSPLSGLLLDNNSTSGALYNFKLLFLMFFGLVMLSIVLVGSLQIEDTDLQSTVVKIRKLPELLKDIRINLIFAVVFVSGATSGYLDTFLFWNLEDKLCPHYVMGLSITIGLVVGLPFTVKKFQRLFHKTSAGTLLSLSIVLQGIRCLGYILEIQYWWCLLFEFIGSVSFHFLWSAMSLFGKGLNSREKDSIFRSCVGAAQYGLGKSVGVFVGGTLLIEYGFNTSYLSLGTSCFTFGMTYFVLYHAFLRRKDFKHSDLTKIDTTETQELPTTSDLLLKPLSCQPIEASPEISEETADVQEQEQLNVEVT